MIIRLPSILPAAAVLILLSMTGCVPAAVTNDQVVIENAVNDDLSVVDDANSRADHLDQKAAELIGQADQAENPAANALRREAESDLAAAAAIRQRGAADGARVEANVERDAGLLNSN